MSKKKKKNSNKKPIKESSKTKQSPKALASKKKPPVDWFEDKLGTSAIYLMLGLLCLGATVVYGGFWFTEQVFLFKDIGSDTINGLYPIYYWNADTWATEGSIPSWSFATGLGQNIMVMNMGDPFVWLMYLSGKEAIIHNLAYIEALKVVLAGLAFFGYLKTMHLNNLAAISGGFMYAFCGFMMVGSGWYLFTIEGLYFAFMLLSFEQFLQYKRWWLFPISIMLIAMWQPVDVYLFALCIATYGTVRILDKNNVDLKDLVLKQSQLAVLGILGLFMGAFLLLPTIELMLNSPRVLGDSTFFDSLRSNSIFDWVGTDLWQTTKARLLSTNLLVNPNEVHEPIFKGAMNFLEAPAIYCSCAAILLFPQAFFFFKKQQRIMYALLLGLYIIPLFLPFVRYSFWLFAGDYYRFYSMFVIFILLFLSAHSIHFLYEKKQVHWISLAAAALLAFGLLFSIGGNPQVVVVNPSNQFFIAMLLALNIVFIALWSVTSFQTIGYIGFLAILIVDVLSVARPTLNDRRMATVGEFTSDRVGYNDFTIDAVQYIHSIDSSFHRIEKYGYYSGLAMHSSINDAKVQGYMGTKSYHSFNQLNYIRFLGALDIINPSDENQTRWAPGLGPRQLLNMLVSNKYILTKSGPQQGVGVGYQYLKTIEDVTIWQNQNFLPFGFTYDKMIARSNFKQLKKDNITKDIALMRAVVVEDEQLSAMNELTVLDTQLIKPRQYSEAALANDVQERKKESFKLSFFSNAHLKGSISLSKPKMVFFSIPYDDGWSAIVNGKSTDIQAINIGFSGLMLPKGQHNIELIYATPYAQLGRWISCITILMFIGLLLMQDKIMSKFSNKPKTTIQESQE